MSASEEIPFQEPRWRLQMRLFANRRPKEGMRAIGVPFCSADGDLIGTDELKLAVCGPFRAWSLGLVRGPLREWRPAEMSTSTGLLTVARSRSVRPSVWQPRPVSVGRLPGPAPRGCRLRSRRRPRSRLGHDVGALMGLDVGGVEERVGKLDVIQTPLPELAHRDVELGADAQWADRSWWTLGVVPLLARHGARHD